MKKTQKNMSVDGVVVATFRLGETQIEMFVDYAGCIQNVDLGQYLLDQAASNLQYDVDRDIDIKIEDEPDYKTIAARAIASLVEQTMQSLSVEAGYAEIKAITGATKNDLKKMGISLKKDGE